jgi:hypothetical protein
VAERYIKAAGYVFHRECFTCAGCKEIIVGNFKMSGEKFYHPRCYNEKSGLFCHVCGKVLEGEWLEQGKKKFHPQCLDMECDICGQYMTGEFVTDDEGKYHEACYLNRKAPRCCVCDAPIKGKYVKDPWGNTAHPAHKGRKVDACDYCSRIIGNTCSNGGYNYADGRNICGICRPTAVESNLKVRRSMMQVLRAMAAPPAGFRDIPGSIPIQLVDRPTLRRLSGFLPVHGQGFTASNITLQDGKRVKVQYRIYILHGLPQLQFQSVLAHEFLHVWLMEKDIKLSTKDMEGFCNLGSALLYETEDSPFARFLLKQLEENPDRLYGGGYRKMKRLLQRLGWNRLKGSLR